MLITGFMGIATGLIIGCAIGMISLFMLDMFPEVKQSLMNDPSEYLALSIRIMCCCVLCCTFIGGIIGILISQRYKLNSGVSLRPGSGFTGSPQ